MTIKAVLLDLDNTLILFDEPEFYRSFFQRMASAFEDLMPAEELKRRVVAATLALKDNRGSMRNRDWFSRAFDAGAGLPMDRFWNRWLRFYRDIYGPFGTAVTVPAGQAELIDRLKRRRVPCVIASNPIFPDIALKRRMAWGGLDPTDFSLLTTMDNMSFVKPHAGYFKSIADAIGVTPGECLMVGNDPVNDMAAAGAGMMTYRTTDALEVHFASLTEENRPAPSADRPSPDFQGPLSRVWETIEALLK
jgi:FMN phosphatase YigB (HAD superfamily)